MLLAVLEIVLDVCRCREAPARNGLHVPGDEGQAGEDHPLQAGVSEGAPPASVVEIEQRFHDRLVRRRFELEVGCGICGAVIVQSVVGVRIRTPERARDGHDTLDEIGGHAQPVVGAGPIAGVEGSDSLLAGENQDKAVEERDGVAG